MNNLHQVSLQAENDPPADSSHYQTHTRITAHSEIFPSG